VGGVPRSESNASKNYVQLSLISASTTANANEYIWLFASLEIVANSWPLCGPFKKHASKPMIGRQPARKPLFMAAKDKYSS
jgi:hypothetical protein